MTASAPLPATASDVEAAPDAAVITASAPLPAAAPGAEATPDMVDFTISTAGAAATVCSMLSTGPASGVIPVPTRGATAGAGAASFGSTTGASAPVRPLPAVPASGAPKPHAPMSLPDGEYFWTQDLSASSMNTFPAPSTDRPTDRLGCCTSTGFPKPYRPMSSPETVYFSMHEVFASSRYTFPAPSSATPTGVFEVLSAVILFTYPDRGIVGQAYIVISIFHSLVRPRNQYIHAHTPRRTRRFVREAISFKDVRFRVQIVQTGMWSESVLPVGDIIHGETSSDAAVYSLVCCRR